MPLGSPSCLLVVSESSTLAEQLGISLRETGLKISRTDTAARARELIDCRPFDLVVADLASSLGTDGLLSAARTLPADLPVIVAAPGAPVGSIVEAMKKGAMDFVPDPAEPGALLLAVQRALRSIERATEQPTSLDLGSTLVGDSPSMRQIADIMKRSSSGSATVLIRGETGTGKEVIARAMHQMGPQRDGPFIKVHCAALPDALLESELFGYEKGAFTGAGARKPGRVELAQGGTLFLDEIGDVTPAVQVKLLRVLQDREFERLGGTETLRTNARFCAATHRDLEGMIQRGQFREDLYYRLNVVSIWAPPLRARRMDIDALARLFCARFAAAHGKPHLAFDDEAIRVLRRERWPGNVRQLQNFVERLVVLSTSSIIGAQEIVDGLSPQVSFKTQAPSSIASPASLPPAGPVSGRPGSPPADGFVSGPLAEQVRRAERDAIVRALDHATGNRTVAARILGINRRTLYNKMVDYGLGNGEDE